MPTNILLLKSTFILLIVVYFLQRDTCREGNVTLLSCAESGGKELSGKRSLYIV